ncbi:hypothetical protein BKA64DRAFT_344163 [Cadophora sp. MPI-SDFR-AT-0126]|nr:hypothetical protein BKA64DRAFT_344163 [Leotiomycetes sp. MPI-SDFR-AT-0126]
MALVQLAAARHHPSEPEPMPTKPLKAKSDHQDHKRRRLQKATPGCYFDTRFSPGQKIIGDSSIIGVQSCLEVEGPPADDDVMTGGRNHQNQNQNQDAKLQLQELSPQPRIEAHQKSQRHVHFLQPPSNLSNDSISIYSTHSSVSLATNKMDAAESEMQLQMQMQLQQHRRRSKTPVFFVGQLERKSVASVCELDKAQLLASEYQALLPLRLKTSFAQSTSQSESHFQELDVDHDYDNSAPYRPKTPKRLRKIKCQVSLRDLVKQHSQCGPSPSTPVSDAETLVGSLPCSPLDEDFDKQTHQPLFSPHHDTQIHNISSDEDDELSLPSLTTSPSNDIGLKICTELLTNELATALLRHHHPLEADTKDRASGLQILLMIEAYETVQSQVRRMLYDARVTGKQFGHVHEAERILEHWLMALYAVYDREQEEENRRSRLDC